MRLGPHESSHQLSRSGKRRACLDPDYPYPSAADARLSSTCSYLAARPSDEIGCRARVERWCFRLVSGMALNIPDRSASERLADSAGAVVNRTHGPEDLSSAVSQKGRQRCNARRAALSTVVIKAIRRCNLKCPYCYYINDSTPRDSPVITQRTVVRLYELVADYVAKDSEPFAFVWHGGEPTLLGRRRLGRFLDLQREYFTPGRVENAIQTNGTLIDDEWCEFFRDHDLKVGVSVDGYREVHDLNRITIKGEGTYDKVVASVAKLKAYGIDVGILMVASGSADAAKTIDSLRALGVEYCDFLLPMSNNALEDARESSYRTDHCHFARAGEFLRLAFRKLATDSVHLPSVRLFNSIIQNAFGLPHGYLNAGSANVAENVILEPNGELCLDADFWHIDRFSLGEEYHLSRNIHSPDFTFFLVEEELERLIREKGLETLPTACQRCRVRSLCRASHPASRYGADTSFNHRSAYCEAMYAVCDEILNYLEEKGYADCLYDVDLKKSLTKVAKGV
jgi:uncharacterized protein